MQQAPPLINSQLRGLMMNQAWCLVALNLALATNILFPTQMSCKEKPSMKPLALKVTFESHDIALGTELRPSVYVVNTSGKTIDLEYVMPLLMVPVIVDATTNRIVPNAPTYVFDQISAFKKTVLQPNGELSLYALPILIKEQSSPAGEINHAHAFWNTQPGSFRLKYSVKLKQLMPGAMGELQAELPLKITYSKMRGLRE